MNSPRDLLRRMFDAVMLSAESASGKYPVEAVQMMERINGEVEADSFQRLMLDSVQTKAQATTADAICAAMNTVAGLLPVAAIVTYTTSGSTSVRAARERPSGETILISAGMPFGTPGATNLLRIAQI